MSDALFSSDVESADTRYLWRHALADLLDLATSVMLGWGGLRAVDADRTPLTLVLAGAAAWLTMCAVGGLSGWTLWRGVVGIRLTTDGDAPGTSRGLARAFPAVLELLLAPVLQRRPFDRPLKIHPEAALFFSRQWRRSLGWMGLWVGLVLVAVWFMVMPTRREALVFLRKLDGWRCCHAQTPPTAPQCTRALSRVVSAAKGGDPQAQALVADCPRASASAAR